MTYREKEELRKEISLLRELMNIQIEGYNPSRQQRLKSVEGFKKRIREKLKQYNEVDDVHYSENGESCWWKEYFDEPFTEEEKREFIEDRWVHINLPWSPTGQWFTSHIAVCNVDTSFGAKSVDYHFMSLDC